MVDIHYFDEVEGCFYVECKRYHDDRGFFQELLNADKYPPNVSDCKQVSTSLSKKNVLRGIHTSQHGKLVSCLSGSIMDYCIDLRVDSPTYLKYCKIKLSSDTPKQFYIPPGCGHLFVSLEDNTLICYMQGGTFKPEFEMDVNYKDKTINLDISNDNFEYIISEKDRNAPSLEEARKLFLEKQNSIVSKPL